MTFVPNIPQSGQSLGQTRDDVRNNFGNYSTVIAVDHLGPNGSGAGQHKKVTFSAANVPAAGTTTPPILFTNIQDGAGNALPGSLAQLFFYTGLDAKSRDQYISGAQGSTLLTGGIILKWGTANANAATTLQNFIAPFPNNCFCVIVQSTNASYDGLIVVPTANVSVTGFYPRRLSGIGNTGVYYIAIGN